MQVTILTYYILSDLNPNPLLFNILHFTITWMDTVQAKQEQLLAIEREQQEKMEKFRAKMLIERESHEMALQARTAAKEEVTIKEV